MQTWSAELLYRSDLLLGEGAIWHPEWQQFLYVDIEGKKLGCIDPANKSVKEIGTGKKIGTVVPAANNKLIIGVQGAIVELDFGTAQTKELVKVETNKPCNRCNDGKCDAAGRLWIGTMHENAKPRMGALYVFDGDLKKRIDNVSVSNGICWSKDNRIMYYIDSFDRNIKAYDFDIATGTITNERIVIRIKDTTVLPDGMCIDEEDMLWVAIWGGSAVHRYNPSNGALVGKVLVNAPHVTSCAFGGDKMQQLFITTAASGHTEQQLSQHPLSGSLFIADTDIKGIDTNYFRNGL